jgi:hypothetical protein
VVLYGKATELMVRGNPGLYCPYIIYSKMGVHILYTGLSKALYGMVRTALQLYRRLRGDLDKMGLFINPCASCVATMMVNESQCTICWHVDNLNISRADETVVTPFSLKLVDLYKGDVETHRDEILRYLGMDLGFRLSPGAMLDP